MGTSDERPDDGGDALSAPGGVPDDVDGCHYAALVGEADLDDDLGNDYDPAEYELTGAELGELLGADGEQDIGPVLAPSPVCSSPSLPDFSAEALRASHGHISGSDDEEEVSDQVDVPEVPATGVDPGDVEEAEPQFADETEPNAESWMEPTETTITIDGMSTKAIKAELKRRALSTTGKVAALKQRLKDAVGGNTFLSTVAECVEWIEETREVWKSDMCATAEIEFLRLNVIDMYNHGMGSVDVADQLRNTWHTLLCHR